MERPGLTEIDDDRCDFLRWKGLYIEAAWDPSEPHSGDRAFWCHKTQTCLGPDNQIADEYECNETRPCYRPL
ncbi:MAG: hypothetical protein FJW39_23610 [Acidobacteria bacterium]|nr:hypothetical protein [Acidobacteriota bacterium]